MKRPGLIASIGGAAAVVAAVAVVTLTDQPDVETPLPEDLHTLVAMAHLQGCDGREHLPLGGSRCVRLRSSIERAVANEIRTTRRTVMRESAATVREGLRRHRYRSPKVGPPPEVLELLHGLERRAKE